MPRKKNVQQTEEPLEEIGAPDGAQVMEARFFGGVIDAIFTMDDAQPTITIVLKSAAIANDFRGDGGHRLMKNVHDSMNRLFYGLVRSDETKNKPPLSLQSANAEGKPPLPGRQGRGRKGKTTKNELRGPVRERPRADRDTAVVDSGGEAAVDHADMERHADQAASTGDSAVRHHDEGPASGGSGAPSPVEINDAAKTAEDARMEEQRRIFLEKNRHMFDFSDD
ncbi:MAG: hypothetical protein ACYCSN_10085 [Acidobacteriaceae bacterium]